MLCIMITVHRQTMLLIETILLNILINNMMKIKTVIQIISFPLILLVGYAFATHVTIPNWVFKEQNNLDIDTKTSNILCKRFNTPEGYDRMAYNAQSFESWLRNASLKKYGTSVYLFNGDLKRNQQIHAAVLNVDVGTSDLQQCADAVMRLRAEYLFYKKAFDSITFTFTNGTKVPYSKWRAGYRTQVSGNTVAWVKKTNVDTSYVAFRKYLNTVFMYCGTYSLAKELKSTSIDKIKAGDVFITGGFPGHAMMVMDVAKNKSTGKKIFMIAQSYMPAQDIHIVKNLNTSEISPWFEIPENGSLETPEWTFDVGDLKRF
jgi:hypothetical protein